MPTLVPHLSVLIATRNRCDLLAVMLRSLDQCLQDCDRQVEVILVDSASSDGTGALIDAWAATRPQHRAVHVAEPGKSRALNAALRLARAPLLVFSDDDVELRPSWLASIAAFFAEHEEYAAAIGRVRTPPQVTDPDTLARVDLYGTLPLYDRGDRVEDSKHLYGCNMAIRRGALEQVGSFDEELGPGASGLHEDGDMARRILGRGLRIGYMPDAIVYHTVEVDRLTFAFFREMHCRDARSRFVLDRSRSRANVLWHWLGSAAGVACWTLLLNRKRMMKALGRLVSHTEMLRLVTQSKSEPQSDKGSHRRGVETQRGQR